MARHCEVDNVSARFWIEGGTLFMERDDEYPEARIVCGKFCVLARCHRSSYSWGLLVAWLDPSNNPHFYDLSAADIVLRAKSALKPLYKDGIDLRDASAFWTYLQSFKPELIIDIRPLTYEELQQAALEALTKVGAEAN